jgi:hypothetical protein
MKKMVLGLTAVAAIATAAISPAEARWRGGWGPGKDSGLLPARLLRVLTVPTDPMGTTDRATAIMGQGIMRDQDIIGMAMPARVTIDTTERKPGADFPGFLGRKIASLMLFAAFSDEGKATPILRFYGILSKLARTEIECGTGVVQTIERTSQKSWAMKSPA